MKGEGGGSRETERDGKGERVGKRGGGEREGERGGEKGREEERGGGNLYFDGIFIEQQNPLYQLLVSDKNDLHNRRRPPENWLSITLKSQKRSEERRDGKECRSRRPPYQ